MTPLHERLHWLLTLLGHALGAYARRLAAPPQPVVLGHTTYFPRLPAQPFPPLAPALLRLFWDRTGRALRRVAALYQAWQAGTLRPPRPRALRPAPPAEAPAAEPRPARLRLPHGFAWLHRHAPETGPITGHMESLLHQEEMRRFAAEVPRAGRLLRPICRALGLHPPPEFRLPPRPRRPRAPRPRRPRPLPLTHPDLGLAPNIIRAVRYWRKKYGRD